MKKAFGEIEYELVRTGTSRLSLKVDRDGNVTVRAPRGMDISVIENFLSRHREKVNEMVSTAREGKSLRLSKEEMDALVKKARKVFPERVEYWRLMMGGIAIGKVTVRSQLSRWGSCSQNGNISLNALLVEAPPRVLDYVIVHELAHRLQMNHSKAFWSVVQQYCDDYKECRKWLRENGGRLMALNPR
ncbi:MAG: M48 family metallopeptidase [Clostridia bacterium]|nr:M48 family metallopeptidase [Clostridia bacterium]